MWNSKPRFDHHEYFGKNVKMFTKEHTKLIINFKTWQKFTNTYSVQWSTAALKKMQSIMNLETKEKIGIFVMKFNFTVYEIWAPSSSRIDDATRKLKVWIIECAKLTVDFIVSRYQH